MGTLEIVLGIVLLVLAVALIALVLMQQGKDKKLSGAIAGGMDNFLGGAKGDQKDKLYSTLTAVFSAIFAILVIVLYVIVG